MIKENDILGDIYLNFDIAKEIILRQTESELPRWTIASRGDSTPSKVLPLKSPRGVGYTFTADILVK